MIDPSGKVKFAPSTRHPERPKLIGAKFTSSMNCATTTGVAYRISVMMIDPAGSAHGPGYSAFKARLPPATGAPRRLSPAIVMAFIAGLSARRKKKLLTLVQVIG